MGLITERKTRNYSGLDADKADIPAAAKSVSDEYFATDTKTLYKWDGSAWVAPAAAGDMLYADTRFKVGTFDKEMADAPGNIVISGLGFSPKLLFLYTCEYNTTGVAWGFATGAGAESQHITKYLNTGNFASDPNYLAVIFDSAADQGRLSFVSFDADGFTLNYDKGGNPAGVLNCRYLAFR